MLKKLTTNETIVLNESKMNETTGKGLLYCVTQAIPAAYDCMMHGEAHLAAEIWDEIRVSSGPGII